MADQDKGPKKPFTQAVKDAQADDPPATPPPAEPPKEPDTPPATPPTDADDGIPASLDDKGKANWKALREEKKAVESKLNEIQAKLQDQESQRAQWEAKYTDYSGRFKEDEFNQLRESNLDLQYRLSQQDLNSDPKVKAAADSVRQVQQTAQEVMDRVLEGMPGVQDLLSLDPATRDRKIEAFAKEKEIPGTSLARVYTKIDRLEEAQAALNTARKDVSVDLETWQAKREQASRQEMILKKNRANDLFQNGLQAAMSDEGLPQYFRKQEGDTDEAQTFNRLVDESTNYSREILTGELTEEKLAEAAFFAGVGRTSVAREEVRNQVIASLNAENQQLKDRLAALEKATPGSGFSGGGSTPPAGSKDSARPFMDRVKSGMAEIGQ